MVSARGAGIVVITNVLRCARNGRIAGIEALDVILIADAVDISADRGAAVAFTILTDATFEIVLARLNGGVTRMTFIMILSEAAVDHIAASFDDGTYMSAVIFAPLLIRRRVDILLVEFHRTRDRHRIFQNGLISVRIPVSSPVLRLRTRNKSLLFFRAGDRLLFQNGLVS